MERIRNTFRDKGVKGSLILLILAMVPILILIVLVAYVLNMKIKERYGEPESDRIECPGFSESECTSKNCVFDRVEDGPSCFMRKDSFGYKVKEEKKMKKKEEGLRVQLKSTVHDTPYGDSIQNVDFVVTYLTENIVRFQFKDADNDRYEVPVQEDFPLLQDPPKVNTKKLKYVVSYDKTDKTEMFYFTVEREKKKGKKRTKLWDSRLGALILSNQYLQIGSLLPSSNIYGLGEHVHDSLRHDMNFKSWPMFSKDEFPEVGANNNLYGVHPFYTCLEDDSGASHGVLLLNSNAMEVTLMPEPAIIFRTIGGILDFFIFVGDNPEHVIELYTSLIGRPMIPPYWSLGFQLSRYGYESLNDLKDVMERNKESKIPQTVQYLDIDYMEDRMDFTYDKDKFEDLPSFIKEKKKKDNMKWVIILDPGIAAVNDYEPYEKGLNDDIYVKQAPLWTPAMFPQNLPGINVTFGKVWPDAYVAFPDFFHNNTKNWWEENIVEHRETIEFDGLWIDMNEPANFETNSDNPTYCNMEDDPDCWVLRCPKSMHDDPPYNPLLKSGTERLSEKTLCMECIHGDNVTPYLHYNVHSLYGWSQTQPTLEAAQKATDTRSLVISRSTYPSSGRYAGHWLGDNQSTFEDLKRSIIGMMEFNMFGIPYVGADVCGFFGTATPELCERWMQLGAFYPFFRNHNHMGEEDQDPASFSDTKVVNAARKAIERRIALNPYLYTLFYKAHVDGSTVVRPVFHEFPKDELTWNISTQFMWGKSLLIAPVLEEDRKSVIVYLPKDEWWHFDYEKSRKEPNSERFIIELNADEYTPLYVRGGTILPIEVYDWDSYPEKDNATERKMDLYIFPKDGKAKGELFMDDGISKDTVEDNAYALYDFCLDKCKLGVEEKKEKKFEGPKPYLRKVFVFNAISITEAGKFDVKMDEDLQMAAITVNTEMDTIGSVKWKDKDDKCSMED